MGEQFRQLNYEDRKRVAELLEKGYSKQKIALELGVHRGTIYNEIKRGQDENVGTYNPDLAQKKYEANLKVRGTQLKIAGNKELTQYIGDKIANGASPETVIRDLRRQGMDALVSTTTIYNYIDRGIFKGIKKTKGYISSDGKRHFGQILRDKVDLGGNLQKARINAAYTQKEIAEILGTDQKTVSLWESNQREPGAQTLGRLCQILSVSADDLLELKNAKGL